MIRPLPVPPAACSLLDAGAVLAVLLGVISRFLPPTRAFRRGTGIGSALLGLLSVHVWLRGGDHRLVLIGAQLLHLLSSTHARLTWEALIAHLEAGAARLAPLSFALAIGLGTIALCLPVASTDGTPMSFIDALFTATSATCVTGLVVKDTATSFSTFGHWVILSLIQVGGLGTMTLSLSLIALFSPHTGRQREAISQVMSVPERVDVFAMMRFLLLSSFLCEGVGWLLLLACEGPPSPCGASPTFVALFHAVSAFCNAGFSLWPDSLERAPVPMILVVSMLVVLGGLGCVILRDVADSLVGRGGGLLPRRRGTRARALPRRVRLPGWRGLSLHTRLGLVTTGLLIGGGTLVFFLGEYDNTMRRLPFAEKILHAYFQSVTTRTAGFNTLDFARFSPALLFFACTLMLIGACPGGTGGGIKTTTAATLLLSLRSLLSPRGRLEAFGRSIPDSLFQRAVAITLAYLGVLSLGFFLLLVVEPLPPMRLLFEATSAIGTVGLSTGITSGLGATAKVILIGLMYVGRVGPLSLALMVGHQNPGARYRYPDGHVLVG